MRIAFRPVERAFVNCVVVRFLRLAAGAVLVVVVAVPGRCADFSVSWFVSCLDFRVALGLIQMPVNFRFRWQLLYEVGAGQQPTNEWPSLEAAATASKGSPMRVLSRL